MAHFNSSSPNLLPPNRSTGIYRSRQGGKKAATMEAGRGHGGEEGSGGGHGSIWHQCRAGPDGEPWMQGRGRGGSGEHRQKGGRWDLEKEGERGIDWQLGEKGGAAKMTMLEGREAATAVNGGWLAMMNFAREERRALASVVGNGDGESTTERKEEREAARSGEGRSQGREAVRWGHDMS